MKKLNDFYRGKSDTVIINLINYIIDQLDEGPFAITSVSLVHSKDFNCLDHDCKNWTFKVREKLQKNGSRPISRKRKKGYCWTQPMETCKEAYKNYEINTVLSLYIEQVILHAVKLDLPKVYNTYHYDTPKGSKYTKHIHRLTAETKLSYFVAKLLNKLSYYFKDFTGKSFKKSLRS
ncbi:hypothetical protein J6590_026255 [Homalodisca vitripennis]|nr:hypothetical protein J6590_026255 [Homalodisca vitripennis]